MKKGLKRKMLIGLGVIALIVVIIVVYFNIPYFSLKNEFNDYLSVATEDANREEITEEYKINDLPEIIQKFYKFTGLENKVDSKHVRFNFKDADFLNSSNNNGTMEVTNWSAEFSRYIVDGDMTLPNEMKAIWHFEDKDLVYFNGTDIEYTFY